MNSDYLQKIGEVIKEIGELRPSDVHKLQKLHEYGSTGLAEELARITAKNVKEIYDIFDLVAQDNYAYAEPFYKASGINYVPYSENEELKVYTRLIAKQTAEEYINFTQTTAFAVFDKTGESIAPLFAAEKDKMKTTLSDTYIKLVDYAAGQVQFGAESYQSAMRDVIKAMADSGIRTVDYATGFSKRLDSAVRQNILWGVKQYNQQSAELIGEDFGADGYEIPYHSNPRPTHAEMGGRLYAKGEAVRIKGVFYPSIKTVEPLLNDYGCLHYKIPVILGVSQPAYSERELEALKEKDNRTFEFEGKRYTGYEAKQTQRQIESAIRKQKDLSIIAGAAGEKDLQLAAQEKLNLLAGKYAKFSKAADLPTRVERLRVEGFKSVKLPQKPLTNARNGGIISKKRVNEVQDVHYVGKLDRNIYKCITEDITTDEVIITDERIRHINDHHPGHFENISSYLQNAICNPDYILKDAENTGLILKEVEENGLRIQIVLRVHTSSDTPGFKNSIISAWRISENRWKNYIKNKKILYKSE